MGQTRRQAASRARLGRRLMSTSASGGTRRLVGQRNRLTRGLTKAAAQTVVAGQPLWSFCCRAVPRRLDGETTA
ncbi:hypothetical protein AAHC03_024334 [Spirometra sp. Aus1]